MAENTWKLCMPRLRTSWIWIGVVLFALVVAAVARPWLPARHSLLGKGSDKSAVESDGHKHGDAHNHDHAGHKEESSLELSAQAQQSIGLKVAPVKLQMFERTISVPGVIKEQPGKSTIAVTAPLTGVITGIHAIQGEALEPGKDLFDMRLTHEELVQAQTDFLRTAEEFDVTMREVKRLEKGREAVAGKTILERKYEAQKQEAALRAQRQALLLHGLTKEQVETIFATRTLLQGLTVKVPTLPTSKAGAGDAQPLILQELKVTQGQHLTAGDGLCELVNHSELLVEGTAFSQDAPEIEQALSKNWKVSITMEGKSVKPERIGDLQILYLANEVDAESRAFHFYVTLPNRMLRDTKSDGRRFIYWKFKPGQRVQVHVPVERWPDRIVLPVEAVAQDGAESFVFQANGDHFDRRPVHVEYRDQFWAVIANDGSIFPGDMVATSGAHQLQLALKNKAGGAIDPHAGHNH